MSLYDEIGGEPKVRAVLRSLYDKLFEDPMVGFLFAGKDKERIVDRQVAFTCGFLGGPQAYTGRPLPEVHASLPLLPGHFDRRHRLLAQVLAESRVPTEVSHAWLRIDESLRSSVLAAAEEARTKTREQ
jgi:truncated hemoglobin YjbI